MGRTASKAQVSAIVDRIKRAALVLKNGLPREIVEEIVAETLESRA